MSNAIPTELSVNGKNYSVIKLLGKGKGGYFLTLHPTVQISMF